MISHIIQCKARSAGSSWSSGASTDLITLLFKNAWLLYFPKQSLSLNIVIQHTVRRCELISVALLWKPFSRSPVHNLLPLQPYIVVLFQENVAFLIPIISKFLMISNDQGGVIEVVLMVFFVSSCLEFIFLSSLTTLKRRLETSRRANAGHISSTTTTSPIRCLWSTRSWSFTPNTCECRFSLSCRCFPCNRDDLFLNLVNNDLGPKN